ncbi:MAG: hypothetical protein HQK88_11600 [Nitrospirae bacterium]|nr:hypothetical protein [Nitrospirota bacterium]MBF0535527.1 hypothetical protein [Nitrospirota bacterium]MBF0617446.1 hypothetical protein [Nitrospirota bacterium]
MLVRASEDIHIPMQFRVGVKNMFFDWWYVEAGYGMPFWRFYQDLYGTHPWLSPYGIELKITKPEISDYPIAADDPLGLVGAYSTLMFDNGKYRLWYCTYDFSEKGIQENDKLCYMESDDCKHWHRPELGLIEYKGSKSNNIVYGWGDERTGGVLGAHGATVFKDDSAPAPERYKLVHLGQAKKVKDVFNWLYGAVSPDGIHWTLLDEPVLEYLSDTQSVACYIKEKKKYVLYVRGWSPQNRHGFGGKRIVRKTESRQFGKFPPPKAVLTPEISWGPSADIYTNSYNKWPGADMAHIMFPAIYHRDTDTLSLHLALSRDGNRWFFPSQSALYSNEENPEKITTYAGVGLVPYEGKQWAHPVFFSRRAHNEYRAERPAIYLATVREDGIVGIEAPLMGEFYTYPCIFKGSEMLINSVSYPGGEIKIEVLELKPRLEAPVFDGFSLNDCDVITGNNHWSPVTFKGNKNISKLAGKIIRFRFKLIRSRVFGFMFI